MTTTENETEQLTGGNTPGTNLAASNTINAYAADKPVDIPATKITIQQVHWGQDVPVPAEWDLEAAIEALCYDFLEQEHDGWENNDGAYGEFTISIADRTIELEFSPA